MSYSLSNKKFNHSVHEYLLNSDLINKYKLRNIYKKPKLKKANQESLRNNKKDQGMYRKSQ